MGRTKYSQSGVIGTSANGAHFGDTFFQWTGRTWTVGRTGRKWTDETETDGMDMDKRGRTARTARTWTNGKDGTDVDASFLGYHPGTRVP